MAGQALLASRSSWLGLRRSVYQRTGHYRPLGSGLDLSVPARPHRCSTAVQALMSGAGIPQYANMSSAVVRFTLSRGMQPSLLRLVSRPGAGLRRPLTAGPLAVVVVVVAMLSALVRGLMHKIAADVRACGSCRGFGIGRCKLCEGRGVVGWEGKWSHFEPCPLCLGRRFTRCECCGGLLHKPLFRHCSVTVTAESFASMAPRIKDPTLTLKKGKQEQEVAVAPAGLAKTLSSKLAGSFSSLGSKRRDSALFGAQGQQEPQPFRYVFMDD